MFNLAAPPTLRKSWRCRRQTPGACLRPGHTRVHEGCDLNRDRAVLKVAAEEANERRAHLDVADEHPAADQAVGRGALVDGADELAIGPGESSRARSRARAPDIRRTASRSDDRRHPGRTGRSGAPARPR